MTLMHNPFIGQDEVLFITYEDVIKSNIPFLLDQIINTKIRDHYLGFINMLEIDGMDMKNLIRLAIQRTDKNIFKYLAITEFDYEKTLDDLIVRFPFIYNSCPMLAMGSAVGQLMVQKFVSKIYVYTEKYDSRIHLDLQTTYHNMTKLNYITGPFDKVIEKVGNEVTGFILNDVELVPRIFQYDIKDSVNILIARLGYNYTLNEEGGLTMKVDFTPWENSHLAAFTDFSVLEMDDSYFTQAVKG